MASGTVAAEGARICAVDGEDAALGACGFFAAAAAAQQQAHSSAAHRVRARRPRASCAGAPAFGG
jgi:hypothetical protein